MSAVTQSGGTDVKSVPQVVAKAPAPVVVKHQEPQQGGSFTRNLSTGELVKSENAGRKPNQE